MSPDLRYLIYNYPAECHIGLFNPGELGRLEPWVQYEPQGICLFSVLG